MGLGEGQQQPGLGGKHLFPILTPSSLVSCLSLLGLYDAKLYGKNRTIKKAAQHKREGEFTGTDRIGTSSPL